MFYPPDFFNSKSEQSKNENSRMVGDIKEVALEYRRKFLFNTMEFNTTRYELMSKLFNITDANMPMFMLMYTPPEEEKFCGCI